MIIALYVSKKQMKECIGQRLKYRETSAFGNEYKSNGKFCVSNRPSISGVKGREFFAEVTMNNDLIEKVT